MHIECVPTPFSDLGCLVRWVLFVFLSLCIVCVKQEEGFHLDLDDFLMGLLTMCNELVKFPLASKNP